MKHAKGQPAVRHSDNVAQPAELTTEEHGFDCWNPSPRSNFRMSQYYSERIALDSSSKELQQIVNALSNRRPPKILPAIYTCADLPSIFIKHFANNVEKHRASVASEHITSTLVTGKTTATFSSFEKCQN